MILLIDNYDSFTYNLYQYIGELYRDIQVVRNDEITIEQIEVLHPQALILSPGPGYPMPASPWRRSATSTARFRCWACVWDISPFVKLSAEQLSVLPT